MAVTAGLRRHLHHQVPTPRAFSPPRTQNLLSHFIFHFPSISTCRCNHHNVLLLSPSPRILRARQWDSNAESLNFDGDDDATEQWFELLDDYIDSIWIFKVFRSFGWMLPAIILSMLLTTGPKAFLLALAVPIGQSTFAFAIERYLNRDKMKPKRKSRTKAGRRRSQAYSSRNIKFKDGEKRSVRQEERKKEKGFPSWASNKDVSVSSSSNGQSASSFGGWDELDEVVESPLGSTATRKATQSASGFQRSSPAEKGKTGEQKAPLFLRLLISMFPFLSSLTDIFL